MGNDDSKDLCADSPAVTPESAGSRWRILSSRFGTSRHGYDFLNIRQRLIKCGLNAAL